MLALVVSPVGKGRYAAHLGDRCVIASAREPFFAAARVLLAEGVDPGTPLTMRHAGSNTVALRSTVGAAAKLTVREDDRCGPKLRLWTPREFVHVPPPIDFSEVA
jgi:hypothetical protein